MNDLLEKVNQFFSDRPGLLPLVGVGLIVLNMLLQVFPGPDGGWFIDANILLHLGLILSIFGLLLIRAWEN